MVTLDTYSHVLPGLQEAAADRLDAMLANDRVKFTTNLLEGDVATTSIITPEQIERLKDALCVCYAIPFIDDVEDFIFEAIFHYALSLSVPDQITGSKTKLLFDAVDSVLGRGWSLKTLMLPQVTPDREFELVVQRADVFDKAEELGFPGLSIDSPPKDLGSAVLMHWDKKIVRDTQTQGVSEARFGVLLKNADRTEFCLYEDKLHTYAVDELVWEWTNKSRKGLRGVRVDDGFTVFRWYSNQKQLFERFVVPSHIESFSIERRRLTATQVVEEVLSLLERDNSATA